MSEGGGGHEAWVKRGGHCQCEISCTVSCGKRSDEVAEGMIVNPPPLADWMEDNG